jgi:putative ATP-binding cassette transporter
LRESNLRFALVHDNEHSEGIALYRGEAEEIAFLNKELDRLVVILRQLVRATTNLTWVTAGYGWFTIVAPIIVAAPAYFGGNLSFGGLMMAAGAFTQVQQSLRWFVDNTGAIADWRATLLRVGGFRRALHEIDKIGEGASHIELVTAADEKLVLQDLEILSASGCIRLNESHVEIMPGEHVLITGAPGSGRVDFFRALAGLWRWGKGKISLPPSEGIMFMPKRAYVPTGALRDILSYAVPARKFEEHEFVAALIAATMP